MRKLYLSFFLLWIAHSLVAQQTVWLSQNPFTSDYSYHSFRHVELPSYANIVNTLIQDEQGMMWIGTKRGLFSYNGYNVNYHQCESDLLESPIQVIIQVTSRYLCIGRDGGIRWFDLEKERYCEPYPELPNMAIRSLEIYDGKLWIGTRDEGVFTFDIESRELVKKDNEGKEESLVFDMENAGDKLFIGSYECLSYYDIQSKVRRYISFGQDKRVTVNALLYDERYDCVWIGTEGKLFKYNISEDKLYPIECMHERSCKTLALDAQGNLLVGTDNGLYIYNPANPNDDIQHVMHDSRNPNSLCNNVIWDIYCDRNQHVWLATDRGISFVQNTLPYKLISLPEIVHNGEGNIFNHLLIDSRGDYWMGGENGLIHINKGLLMQWYKQDNSQFPLRHNRIRHIFEDSDNDIWIATDGGIARYDRIQHQFIYYDLKDNSGARDANWAYCIYEDHLKRFWVATYQGGLFVVDKSKLLAHGSNEPFQCLNNHSPQAGELSKLGNIIYHLESDDKGKLYAVTQEGLAIVRMADFKTKILPFYPFNIVYADNYLWYSEEGKFFCYNPQTEEINTIPLPDKKRQIHSFVHRGNQLWFSATDGIYVVNTETFQSIHVQQTERNLQTGVFHPQDNSILWGGEDCLVSFPILPDKAVKTSPVYITAVYSNKERLTSLSGNQSPRFNHSVMLEGLNDFQLDLSSFTYNNPYEEEFYYRIDEDERWQSLGKGQNRLTFANLSGGTYKLQLCNGNPEENLQAVITHYTIQIPYPWYVTPLAYCVYLMALLIIVGMIIRKIQVHNKRKYEQKEREKSLELSNLKMDFFINISHELKTPLSLIIAPLSRLITESQNHSQRESLLAIHQNALRLNTLIHKILDFKQIESEEENTLIRSHVDLCTLIRNNIQTFSSVLKEKGIKLTFSSDMDYLWLNLDRLKIDSCIINILSNAIKYVHENDGKIEVRLHKNDNEAVITISDNGPGIDEQDLSLIFVRFFQGRNAVKQGTGVGLYLVKKFIGLHGGNVEIKNKQGTIVTLTIPITGENRLTDSMEGDMENPLQQLNKKDKKKILIVDDNNEMVAFLTKIFSKEYVCMKAYDGKEALTVIEQTIPDLVIVDEMMPVMNGLEFSRIIRRKQQMADIPIIMLTAKDDMQTELESIKIGIDAFFSKPFDIKKLELRITQLLYRQDLFEKTMRLENLVHSSCKMDENLRSYDELLLERITKCVEENMEEESFNVSSLALQVGVEQKQLYRKVKQFTGMSPVNYIRKLRMKKAAILLAQQKFTVSEVMYLVGYSNASHFARCFTQEYGMSPKTFMKTKMSTES